MSASTPSADQVEQGQGAATPAVGTLAAEPQSTTAGNHPEAAAQGQGNAQAQVPPGAGSSSGGGAPSESAAQESTSAAGAAVVAEAEIQDAATQDASEKPEESTVAPGKHAADGAASDNPDAKRPRTEVSRAESAPEASKAADNAQATPQTEDAAPAAAATAHPESESAPTSKQSEAAAAASTDSRAPTDRLKLKVAEDYIKTASAKRVMKLFPEVKKTSQGSTLLISKATELFLDEFVQNAHAALLQDSEEGEQTTVFYKHLASVVKKDPRYEFLSELLPEIPEGKKKEKDKA